MKDDGFDIALEVELSPTVVLFLRANSSGTALPCTWCKFCIYGTSGPIYGTGLREIKTTPRLGIIWHGITLISIRIVTYTCDIRHTMGK